MVTAMATAMVRLRNRRTIVKATTRSLTRRTQDRHHPMDMLHNNPTIATTAARNTQIHYSIVLLAQLIAITPTGHLTHHEMDQEEMGHHAVACAEDHLDVADALLSQICPGPLRKVPKVGT